MIFLYENQHWYVCQGWGEGERGRERERERTKVGTVRGNTKEKRNLEDSADE